MAIQGLESRIVRNPAELLSEWRSRMTSGRHLVTRRRKSRCRCRRQEARVERQAPQSGLSLPHELRAFFSTKRSLALTRSRPGIALPAVVLAGAVLRAAST